MDRRQFLHRLYGGQEAQIARILTTWIAKLSVEESRTAGFAAID